MKRRKILKICKSICPYLDIIRLSSPTMHGDELKYITEAYETNWMSTVGANINSAEAEIAAKGSDPHYSYQKRCYLRGRGTSCIQIMG